MPKFKLIQNNGFKTIEVKDKPELLEKILDDLFPIFPTKDIIENKEMYDMELTIVKNDAAEFCYDVFFKHFMINKGDAYLVGFLNSSLDHQTIIVEIESAEPIGEMMEA